eukprot:30953-Chlamydomonas_euryale.AAC.10
MPFIDTRLPSRLLVFETRPADSWRAPPLPPAGCAVRGRTAPAGGWPLLPGCPDVERAVSAARPLPMRSDSTSAHMRCDGASGPLAVDGRTETPNARGGAPSPRSPAPCGEPCASAVLTRSTALRTRATPPFDMVARVPLPVRSARAVANANGRAAGSAIEAARPSGANAARLAFPSGVNGVTLTCPSGPADADVRGRVRTTAGLPSSGLLLSATPGSGTTSRAATAVDSWRARMPPMPLALAGRRCSSAPTRLTGCAGTAPLPLPLPLGARRKVNTSSECADALRSSAATAAAAMMLCPAELARERGSVDAAACATPCGALPGAAASSARLLRPELHCLYSVLPARTRRSGLGRPAIISLAIARTWNAAVERRTRDQGAAMRVRAGRSERRRLSNEVPPFPSGMHGRGRATAQEDHTKSSALLVFRPAHQLRRRHF